MTPQLFCVILLLMIDNVASVNNIIYPNCNTDKDCQIGEGKVFLTSRPEELPKAECGPNKKCLNPYRNGCLRTLNGINDLEGKFRRKIEGKQCFANKFKDTISNSIYKNNITFYPLDWMTPLLEIFIAQIFTEEILFQPTDVLVNNAYSKGFYADELPDEPLYIKQKIPYTTFYPSMVKTNIPGNEFCQKACARHDIEGCIKGPCGHIVMETWPLHLPFIDAVNQKEKGDIMLVSIASGLHGAVRTFVPLWFVEKYPSFINIGAYHEDRSFPTQLQHRAFLAKTFKRPVNWKEYCDKHIYTYPNHGDCPPPALHAEKYFYKDTINVFKGFFTIDKENNCTENPETCAGNLISANKCSWGDIYELFSFNRDTSVPDKMKRMGPHIDEDPKGTYSMTQMVEIWDAAKENMEVVMMWWWYPDPTHLKYASTPAEMTSIKYEAYDEECQSQADDIEYPQLSKNISLRNAVQECIKRTDEGTSNSTCKDGTDDRNRCWSEKRENRKQFYKKPFKCHKDISTLSITLPTVLERM
jgi:hypothetical protein